MAAQDGLAGGEEPCGAPRRGRANHVGGGLSRGRHRRTASRRRMSGAT